MIAEYLKSSIGKKQVAAVSGLALILFLVIHLAANLLAFLGPEAINGYSALLRAHPLFLEVAEVGLTLTFLVHIVTTALVVIENRNARGTQRYHIHKLIVKKSFVTRMMPYTGVILLAYLGTHILDFTFTEPTTMNAIVDGRFQGLYGLIVNSFSSPIRVLWYVIAMVAVGLHLGHAFESVFQTFGFSHNSYSPALRKFSIGFGVAIAGAFSSLPIYFYILGKQIGGY